MDKGLAANLSKKAQDLRSSVTSTAHILQSSVLSTLGMDSQRKDTGLDPQREEEESIGAQSSNASTTTQSISSLEMLGNLLASNLQHLYSSLNKSNYQSLYSPFTKQSEQVCVEHPTVTAVPW